MSMMNMVWIPPYLYLLLVLNHNLQSHAALLITDQLPLASLDHSYCMNEENMSLPSYSHLADEIKATKTENNILKDRIQASTQPVKVLVQ